jgi:hypothetical protein
VVVSSEAEGTIDVDLHATGAHHKLSAHVWGGWAEAASVCCKRFHPVPPPATPFAIERGDHQWQIGVTWRAPREIVARSHDNDLDATRDGAYAVAVASLHVIEGWRALGRAQSASGADLLARRDGDADDDFVKVEVSGMSAGTEPRGLRQLRRRLQEKIVQVQNGDLERPGIAVVVGFELARVLVSELLR